MLNSSKSSPIWIEIHWWQINPFANLRGFWCINLKSFTKYKACSAVVDIYFDSTVHGHGLCTSFWRKYSRSTNVSTNKNIYFVISFCWAVWSSLLSSALVLDQCQVGLLSPIISHWSTTTIIRLPTAWCLAWKNAPLSYNMGRSDTSKGIGTRTPTSIEKSIFQQILVEKNFHLVEMQIELLSRNLLLLSIIRL